MAALAHRRAGQALARIGRKDHPSLAEFDLIYGLTGIGAYLLHRAPGSDALESPVVWMISAEDFESIMETLDVLADATAMQDVEQSKADSAADRYVTAAEMEKIMAARAQGIDIGNDVDVVADMHARSLPDPVRIAALDALIAAPGGAGPVSYRVVLRPAAVRALQRMPEKISSACWEFIHGPLAENPHRVGRPLLEPLAPRYSARRSEYRVL